MGPVASPAGRLLVSAEQRTDFINPCAATMLCPIFPSNVCFCPTACALHDDCASVLRVAPHSCPPFTGALMVVGSVVARNRATTMHDHDHSAGRACRGGYRHASLHAPPDTSIFL